MHSSVLVCYGRFSLLIFKKNYSADLINHMGLNQLSRMAAFGQVVPLTRFLMYKRNRIFEKQLNSDMLNVVLFTTTILNQPFINFDRY